MMEYDKNAYNMLNPDYYSTVYMPSDQKSDNSLSETDVTIFSTPFSSQPQSTPLQSVHERVQTPSNTKKPRNTIIFNGDV